MLGAHFLPQELAVTEAPTSSRSGSPSMAARYSKLTRLRWVNDNPTSRNTTRGRHVQLPRDGRRNNRPPPLLR
ncbi:hypothetical protein GCM10022254_68550 [Actinomadura meridiana]|uniref:Uncharacterized protein n=1 Tax=Actinomadura meridiana TaxID=559626 RepID=A0ABP8CMQ2_9ACTN